MNKIELIKKAQEYAQEKHKYQLDDNGLPFFQSHVEQVVCLIKQVSDDGELIAAAYLHDTLEDTQTTYEELVQEFGYKVAELVAEVTHEGNAKDGYYFPRLGSKSAIMLKFADRLSNISRMHNCWDDKRQADYLKKSRFWRQD